MIKTKSPSEFPPRKKYFASFPNGIKIEITKEYADKILWLQKIIREQRAKVKN